MFALGPTRDAICFGSQWYSYRAVQEFAARLAGIIQSLGLQAGTAVGVLMRNRPTHVAAVLGLLKARHCIVTINPMLPAGPLSRDVLDLRVAVLIADREDWSDDTFASAVRETGAVGIWLATAADALHIGLVDPTRVQFTGEFRRPKPGVAIEMLSSGTTGRPKRIGLDLESFTRSLCAGAKYEAGDESRLRIKSSVAIQWMPLVHIGGLFNVVYSIYTARPFVLMERFDVDRWHELIVLHRPRFANLPPSALREILDRKFPREDFSSLLALRCGAAPLDDKAAVEFERACGVPVLQGYGATEFAGSVAGWTLRDHMKYAASKRGSVGRANAGVELRIVDRATFGLLSTGQIGLLEVKTGQIDGGSSWVRTTDLARLDNDGFLYILGRADSAINRGGFKIMPGQVEAAILEHADVREACVVGLPDGRLGEVPAAAVVTRSSDAHASEEALKQFLRERLKPYELPVTFSFLEALPRTPSLKVSQAAVRELLMSRCQ